MSLSKEKNTTTSSSLTALPQRVLLRLLRGVAPGSSRWLNRMDFAVGAEYLRQYKELFQTNSSFANRHKGARCFILGNGPSLNQQDLTLLTGELSFVTNAFWKNPIVATWQPTYYFLTDPLYFDPKLTDTMSAFFSDLRERIHSSTFFVNVSVKDVIEQTSFLPPERLRYVGLAGNLADDLTWEPDLTTVMPGVRNVIQLAMIAAIYMGCREIYLMGVDHDWLSHKGEDNHFYQGPEIKDERVPSRVDCYGYRRLMEFVLIMWKGYESLRRVAEARGVRIVNLTPGGFLDVFERETYESVMKRN